MAAGDAGARLGVSSTTVGDGRSEIGVGATAAVIDPLCYRPTAVVPAACGAAWLTTRWTSEWPYVSCSACLEHAPGADLLPPGDRPPWL